MSEAWNGKRAGRPERFERTFWSEAVERRIERICGVIGNEALGWMFERCYPNTLDTTVWHTVDEGGCDTFVITGDIEAMWLRDSTAQVWPYLDLMKDDEALERMVRGLVHRQVKCILLDGYANAFYRDAMTGEWESDRTEMRPGVHERKWELDSLCYFLRLSTGFWRHGGTTEVFDADWLRAIDRVLEVLDEESCWPGAQYRFQREALRSTETLALDGLGQPGAACGLVRSAFRPSDDACLFPYLIPSNAFLVVALRDLAGLLEHLAADEERARRCRAVAERVDEAIRRHGVVEVDRQRVFAYEVDGFGGRVLMDDANIPSLLSLPYLGYCDVRDPVYQATRQRILSCRNPFFFKGEAGEGIGGPHVGMDFIWPMSIIMRALTSVEDGEIATCLEMLERTHAGTGFMHESFHKDDPSRFTRSWFGWVNSLFGELILKVLSERPHLLRARS